MRFQIAACQVERVAARRIGADIGIPIEGVRGQARDRIVEIGVGGQRRGLGTRRDLDEARALDREIAIDNGGDGPRIGDDPYGEADAAELQAHTGSPGDVDDARAFGRGQSQVADIPRHARGANIHRHIAPHHRGGDGSAQRETPRSRTPDGNGHEALVRARCHGGGVGAVEFTIEINADRRVGDINRHTGPARATFRAEAKRESASDSV